MSRVLRMGMLWDIQTRHPFEQLVASLKDEVEKIRAYFGKYFHDVHPPLGKLLIGLAGKLTGFTGDFAFDSGQEFPKNLRHGLMRMFVSTFGSAIVPFGYLTAKFLGLSKRCRLLTAVLLLFASRYIFAILTKNGPESYSMDSVFISKLEGSGLDKNRIEVADGANVTLRATILNGGLLHSHLHTYPGGSKEQQVTSFRGFDFNNYWTITVPNPATNLDFIKDGTVINLIHHGSGLLLTAQPSVDSPVQKGAYEVSASALSSNAQWKVRIYDDRQAWHVAAVNAITTRVQFENVNGKCMLASADRHLPAWGFNQLEVNCIPNLATTCVDTLWNFEFNYHPKLPVAPKGHIRSRFAWDVYRAHHAMWSTNVGL
ncbi:Protein O-mannosyltransferase 2, partial [Massospora cicadina]